MIYYLRWVYLDSLGRYIYISNICVRLIIILINL